MAKKDMPELLSEWFSIDLTTLTPMQRQRYDAMIAARQALAATKADWESAYAADYKLPDGGKLVFAYRRGPACAIAPVEQEKPKVQAQRKSLADYLAQARANGRAA